MAYKISAFILLLAVVQAPAKYTPTTEVEYKNLLSSLNDTINKLYDYMNTHSQQYINGLDEEVNKALSHIRDKRDTKDSSDESGALGTISEHFNNFKDGFTSLLSNVTSSDLYKKIHEFGEAFQEKGKEVGKKIEQTFTELKNNYTAPSSS